MQCDIPGEGQPQLDPVSSHLTQVIPPQTQDQALLTQEQVKQIRAVHRRSSSHDSDEK